MEIIQNIWMALTTENANLTQIIVSPLAIIEITITNLLFTRILNIQASKQQNLVYIFIFSVVSILSNLFVPVPFNTFLNVIICPILVMVIFKVHILKAVLAQFIPFLFFILVSIPLHSIYVAITQLPSEIQMAIPIYKITFSLITYALVYIIYLILKHFNFNIYLLDDLRKQSTLILLINFLFGIVAVCIQSYIATLYNDKLPTYIALLNLSVLFIYFIFSLFSLIRTNTLERTKRDLEQSQQYNKTLSILHDNIRCFKHDFNNIVTTIGGYVQSGDIQGLKTYYTELLGDCQKVNNLSALSPTVINEPAIYSLLTNKYYLADEKGITINLEVFLDLTELNIKPYEFTRILRYFNGQCY